MVDRGSLSERVIVPILDHHLNHVDSRILVTSARGNRKFLPEDWVPDNWSVLCGRGKECFHHGTCSGRCFRCLVVCIASLLFSAYSRPLNCSLSQKKTVGNRRFRILCEINLKKYVSAYTKMQKSLIVMGIVDAVREGSLSIRGLQGGFIKRDPETNRWYEVGDAVAREKVRMGAGFPFCFASDLLSSF
jgi:hypothetical protein